MAEVKTFRNLNVLSQTRDTVMEILGPKYGEVVSGYIATIQMVMKANNINHFEAMKKIQDETKLSDTPEKKSLFAAALFELTEEINLKQK